MLRIMFNHASNMLLASTFDMHISQAKFEESIFQAERAAANAQPEDAERNVPIIEDQVEQGRSAR